MGIGFPRPGTQFLDKTGSPARPWLRLLQRITHTLSNVGYMISGTHADRLALSLADLVEGTSFFETDRTVIYTVISGTWRFSSGVMQGTLGQQPTDLTAADAGFQFAVQDYSHVVKWCGAAWYFAPGDDRPGRIADFAFAPPGAGWQLCDGSVVTYLTVGAVLATALFTTPALTSSPAYRKTGATYTGVINPAGNTAVDTGAGVAVQAGVGTTVAAHTHVHIEGDPANIVVLPYFRR